MHSGESEDLFHFIPDHVLPPWLRGKRIAPRELASVVHRAVRIVHEWTALYQNETDRRVQYWDQHPASVGWIVCGDERVDPRRMTGMPAGASKRIRVLGGRFETWWAAGMMKFAEWVGATALREDHAILYATYHYSASDNAHLGCAGWSCDVAAARAHAERLRDQLMYVWPQHLTVIVAGIETDRDVLTLHGPQGDVSGERLIGATEGDVRTELEQAFRGGVRSEVLEDVVPYLMGNARCVANIDAHPRTPSELDHAGRIIAIGHGLELPRNEAIIVNDIDHDLGGAISRTASIIAKNLQGTAVGDDALIFTCVPYSPKRGVLREAAIVRASGLHQFAARVVEQQHPALWSSGRFHRLVGIMAEDTKQLEIVDAA